MDRTMIRQIREHLHLTQVQLAQLLGVHPLTVSKWERGELQPSNHEQALLLSFRQASQARKDIGKEVQTLLVTAGVALAIYVLLRAAFSKK